MYLCVGLLGADMFGDSITDNILISFAPCKQVWVDVCSLIYAMAVVISYPLILYSIKVSIIGLCKKDPATPEGYRLGVLISAGYVLLTTALAMLLESILTILGIFASLAGTVFFFAVPILIAVQHPKTRRENGFADRLSELLLQQSSSSQVDKWQENVSEQTVKEMQIGERSGLLEHIADDLQENRLETVEEEKAKDGSEAEPVPKRRKAWGLAAIAVMVAVCAEAVAMNIKDAVEQFS